MGEVGQIWAGLAQIRPESDCCGQIVGGNGESGGNIDPKVGRNRPVSWANFDPVSWASGLRAIRELAPAESYQGGGSGTQPTATQIPRRAMPRNNGSRRRARRPQRWTSRGRSKALAGRRPTKASWRTGPRLEGRARRSARTRVRVVAITPAPLAFRGVFPTEKKQGGDIGEESSHGWMLANS